MKKSVIEKQFKERINAREVTPSKASWDRLDAMLTVAEKPKRSFKWMYIAASLLGFLLIGTMYFNQSNEGTTVVKDPVVINEPKAVPEIKTEETRINLPKRIEATKIIRKQLTATETKSKAGSKSVLSNARIQVVEVAVSQEQQVPVINQKTEQNNVLQKPKYVNVDELLAAVDNVSQKKSSVVNKSNVKVNSSELLTQVDGELDLTFREKAIKTVNQNFKAVKLVLGNRNSE
jgi:hypothetical protein